MKQLINLTPHSISIILGGETLTIPRSGNIARCEVENEFDGNYEYNGIIIPTYRKIYGKVYLINRGYASDTSNFPDAEEGVYYIVSLPVALSLKRNDVFIPGELVRDDAGTVIGCKGLNRV